jgi:hypothetical protein
LVQSSQQLLQIDEDRYFVTATADRQLVGARNHQVLEPATLEVHPALAVDRVLERAPGQDQSHGHGTAAMLTLSHAA